MRKPIRDVIKVVNFNLDTSLLGTRENFSLFCSLSSRYFSSNKEI